MRTDEVFLQNSAKDFPIAWSELIWINEQCPTFAIAPLHFLTFSNKFCYSQVPFYMVPWNFYTGLLQNYFGLTKNHFSLRRIARKFCSIRLNFQFCKDFTSTTIPLYARATIINRLENSAPSLIFDWFYAQDSRITRIVQIQNVAIIARSRKYAQDFFGPFLPSVQKGL